MRFLNNLSPNFLIVTLGVVVVAIMIYSVFRVVMCTQGVF